MQMDKRLLIAGEDDSTYVCPEVKSIKSKSTIPENAPSSRPLTPSNTIVRYKIGFDTKGPHSGWMMLSTRDQASGLSIGIPYKVKSRSNNKEKLRQETDKVVPDLVDQVVNIYEKAGKHKREWNAGIAIGQFDSDRQFTSEDMKSLLRYHKIEGRWSPVGQKEINGLAEVNNKLIGNKVATFYADGPHVPEQLWWRAWRLGCVVFGCHQSLIPGSLKNRLQELSNEEMLWELLAIHPWGQPIEYYFDIPRRIGGVKEHSRTGCYVGPDWDIPGNVMLLNFDTGRLVSAKKYVVLHEISVKWTQQDLNNFVLNKTPEPTIYEEELTEPIQSQEKETKNQQEETPSQHGNTLRQEIQTEIPPKPTET
jgi:hypothetical protein